MLHPGDERCMSRYGANVGYALNTKAAARYDDGPQKATSASSRSSMLLWLIQSPTVSLVLLTAVSEVDRYRPKGISKNPAIRAGVYGDFGSTRLSRPKVQFIGTEDAVGHVTYLFWVVDWYSLHIKPTKSRWCRHRSRILGFSYPLLVTPLG